ncbi:MAG TPA: ATP-binding cassette domain-containing protein [Acidimicrobiales bacterium]|nr:ATP-binding cassette domain-containing protein [Acidimicrobiales bacterium]
MALLQAVGVTKRFGAVTVLRDVDLRIDAGEIVALVGENGAGKSVLVACLARIVEADGGQIHFDGKPLPAQVDQVRDAGIEVVWQDHGLCDDLDAVANIHLGREPGRFLSESGTRDRALAALRRVGAAALPLDRPVRMLSRGQRQLVAVARALLARPRLVLLDEPTASLGVAETVRIQALIRECREAGTGLLLVTHDLEQVFTLADRVVVLRAGRVVDDMSPRAVNRDDLVALISGIEMDSMARRQLHRLRSLVDQLSDVEPAASLPLIVSAMATALDQEMLCVHLLEAGDDGTSALRRSAAVGLPSPLLDVNGWLPLGVDGGAAGLAAARADAMVVEDLSTYPAPAPYRQAAALSGIRSEWAAPIVGGQGVLGTVSGFAGALSRPEPAQLELARLYLGYAASAIERERLLSEVSRRNRVLESLRAMLETLAGPDRVVGGLGASLRALSRAIGADAIGLFVERGARFELHASDEVEGVDGDLGGRLRAAAAAVDAPSDPGRARLLEPDLAAVTLRHPEGRAVVVAHLMGAGTPVAESLELLDDATRSLDVALEGEALERARREAAALRRSQAIQRELLSSLSHELRTPLTAIQGYVSTLRQPDLTWDAASTERFLASIASETARLRRLVGDLLDSSAIESGVLRLQRDWCDLRLVVEAAVGVMGERVGMELRLNGTVEPVWGDHDRLEQVFVNLLENAVTHGASDGGIEVTLRHGPNHPLVEVEVRDHGPGIPPVLGERIFEPRVRGTIERAGAGLGLPIARAIVEAHGGTLACVPVDDGASFLVALPAEPPDAAHTLDGSWNVFDEGSEREVHDRVV